MPWGLHWPHVFISCTYFGLPKYETSLYWHYCLLFVYYCLSEHLFFLAKVNNLSLRTITSLPYSRVVGALLALIFIILIVYLIIQREYVGRSLELIDIGTDYVRDNKRLILMPLGMLLVWSIFFSIELTLIIFIYSIDSNDEESKS